MEDRILLRLFHYEVLLEQRGQAFRRPGITAAIVSPHEVADPRISLLDCIQKNELLPADPGQFRKHFAQLLIG